MYQELIEKKKKLAVIGLGYVGLPIALEFAKKISVIGFDINSRRVEMMRKGIDPSREVDKNAFEGCDIQFTDSLDVLREAAFFIIAVPTPVNKYNMPDLRPLISASETVGKVLKKGDYVLVPVKVNHRYFNDSDEEVKFKVVIQPGNIGYQLLVAVLNGLARDGKVNRVGLPTNWLIRGYLSVASGSNVPGILSWLQPFLNWLYKVAIKRGIDKQLLSHYYMSNALAKV